MQTTDPSLLFQTTADLASAADRERKIRAAEHIGSPIRLASKILDLCIDGDDAYTAESGWQARRVDLTTGETKRLFRGHKGPVTSVVLARISSTLYLFTGSWDKTIRVWNAQTGILLHTLQGHTDFVKSLLILPSPPRLLSTSSDRTARLWSLEELAQGRTPSSVQTIKENSRPIECSVYYPPAVFTADSLGVIKEYKLSPDGLEYVGDISAHATSISDLAVSEDGLWSASMDKSAILHTTPPIILPHPTYVKSILSLDYTLTGSDDEDIRVWDGAKCISTVPGHCDEVTALRSWGAKVVSASLDGTLRRWEMRELLNPSPLQYDKVSASELTEEELRELDELMDE